MDRLLILAGLALGLGSLVVGARALARRRLWQLRNLGAGTVWKALGTGPDGRPTVVAFSTPSCAACWSAQKPALAALQALAGEQVRVVEVDAASNPEVARVFGVLTVPATAVLHPSGQVSALNHGFAATERLVDQLALAGERA